MRKTIIVLLMCLVPVLCLADSFEELKGRAEKGDAYAQYQLGVCYANGDGVTKDMQEAVKWYTISAKLGQVEAQINLAGCYHYGEGVDKNLQEAVRWYRKAADQGYAYAQYNLGLLYQNGEGVVKDLIYAYMWLDLASERAEIMTLRIIALEQKDMISSDMTLSQIEKAKKLAKEWSPKK